jgi:hypothetical protein
MDFAEFFEQTAPGLVRLCFLTTLDQEAAADAQRLVDSGEVNAHRIVLRSRAEASARPLMK